MLHSKSVIRIASMLLVLVLFITGIAPAFAQDTVPTTPEPSILARLGINRIDVSIDENGEPSLFGLPIVATATALGVDASSLKMDKAFVSLLTNANIQNIEVRQSGQTLIVFVNGKLLPYIAWDSSKLDQVMSVSSAMMPSITNVLNVVKGALPLVEKLGVAIAVEFPRKDGTEAIPLSDPTAPLPLDQLTVAKPAVMLELEIVYDEAGIASIAGVSGSDLTAFGIAAPTQITSTAFNAVQANNIQGIELRMRADGLTVYLNNDELVSLRYDRNTLQNAADLYAALNPVSPYKDSVLRVSNGINRLQLGIMATFPVAPGAEIIELITHPNAMPGVVTVGEPAEAATSIAPTTSATPTTVILATPTPAPTQQVLLVDVTCKDGSVHRGLTPEEAAHACPEGGEGW